jgi:molybdate transport repressor ModE-like protein
MIDLKRVRILREVAAQGSFSAAAEELNLSQSAVSQQVATLEREVGMKLLERTPKGPRVTPAGEVLVRHGEAATSRLEEAQRELAALAGLEGGELTLASFPSASATLVTEAISEFSARHPRVRLKLVEAEPEESLPRLRAGELDLALAFDYPAVPGEPDRDVERIPLLTESMYLALPRGHPLADASTVRLADVAEESWLSGVCPSSCGEVVKLVCRDAGFDPRIAFESDDYHVLQGFVAAGLGLTLLPDLALPTLREDIVIRTIEPEAPKRRVWAAVRPVGSRSPATEAMVSVLSEVGERFAAQASEAALAA